MQSPTTRRAFVLALGLLALGAQAQPSLTLDYYLPQGVTYNPAIPTPRQVLGFEVGQWHLSHDQQVRYLMALDAASDRIALEEYGRTYEQRPQLLLTITHPENHAQLEALRTEHLKLTDPSQSASVDLVRQPVVIYQGFSVHGNEPSGGNAAVLVAYYYAAAQGPEVEAQLRNTIVLLDPCYNPDGFTRFSTWVNSNRPLTETADPQARELREPWPGGRTNHYWFDLNRDWMPAQHPESRARVVQYHRWMPNVLTDHHEMGTNRTFFFQPGEPNRNNPYTPKATYALTERIARVHAAALDRIGSLYYTREGYDDFYPGKGSTYPDLNGAVGILFEQASSRGHAQESDYGVLRFAYTVRNQFTTALSTFRAANELRLDLLAHQRSFYTEALAEADRDPVKGFRIELSGEYQRDLDFTRLLSLHNIEVRTGRTPTTLIVPTRQPNYRLVKTFFDTQTRFTDSLFYDISAWNLAYAWGYGFAPLANAAEVAAASPHPSAPPTAGPTPVGGPTPLAYAIPTTGDGYGYRVVYELLAAGLRLQVATEPVPTPNAGPTYPAGTAFLATAGQVLAPGAIQALIEERYDEGRYGVVPLTKGYNPVGTDLGSPSYATLALPRVAIVVGEGISMYAAGELWHCLDQRIGLPVTLLPVERVAAADLGRYTHVVLASGNYGALGKAGTEALKAWAENGGTLVAIASAIRWAAGAEIGRFKLKPIADTNRTPQPYALQAQQEGAREIEGVILETAIDTTHPLFFGFHRSTLPVFRDHTLWLEVGKNPYSTPSRYTPAPLLAGFVNARNLQSLRGTAAVQASRVGQGRIIGIVDDPCFRAFWRGTERIFLNSLFFGPFVRSSSLE